MQFELSEIYEYACIIIGDEILGGQVQDTNMPLLISALSAKGYKLKEVRIITDSLNDIANTLTALRKKYSFVVTMGGLGPTHDDITFLAYAKSFETEPVLHTAMYEYLNRKPRDTEAQKKSAIRMSTMPEAFELVLPDNKWPLLKLENCYAMPGLPHVCKITIDKLALILPTQSPTYYALFFTSAREHLYFEWLTATAQQFQTVNIGSYPLDLLPKAVDTIVSKISLTSKNLEDITNCTLLIKNYLQKNNFLVSYNEIKEL